MSPAEVRLVQKRWRVLNGASGKAYKSSRGSPADGGGYLTESHARAHAAAINYQLRENPDDAPTPVKKFWLDPEGGLHPIKAGMHHGQMVPGPLEGLAPEFKDAPQALPEEAAKHHWYRAVLLNDRLYVHEPKAYTLSRRQTSAIRDYAIEHRLERGVLIESI